MIDKIISYLKQGYQITNKKWEIIPIYFLYSMAVPVAMIILVTVFTIFSMLFIPILDDAQNDTSRIVIFGIIFFILLFLGILIFFILIVTFSAIVTGIRAALKEIMDKDAYPSFSLVNENIKKFFKRSFSFNMIITGYVFIVLLCLGLVLAVLIGISIFVAESFGDESPLFIIIIFLPIIFGVFGYFILIFS
ncbi:MAG: hypothetical protein PHV06_11490, partial [bacterium]|nr:hypothetical protein [bacterium]